MRRRQDPRWTRGRARRRFPLRPAPRRPRPSDHLGHPRRATADRTPGQTTGDDRRSAESMERAEADVRRRVIRTHLIRRSDLMPPPNGRGRLASRATHLRNAMGSSGLGSMDGHRLACPRRITKSASRDPHAGPTPNTGPTGSRGHVAGWWERQASDSPARFAMTVTKIKLSNDIRWLVAVNAVGREPVSEFAVRREFAGKI